MNRTATTLFFILSAMAAMAAMAGCDRSPSSEAEPSMYTRNGPEQAPSALRPASPRASAVPLPGGAPASLATAAPRDTLTDTVITGKIKAAILSDPGMQGADVSVSTDKGVVVLEGTVKSQDQTGIASAHAQRQDGVMRVDSHLAAVAR